MGALCSGKSQNPPIDVPVKNEKTDTVASVPLNFQNNTTPEAGQGEGSYKIQRSGEKPTAEGLIISQKDIEANYAKLQFDAHKYVNNSESPIKSNTSEEDCAKN